MRTKVYIDDASKSFFLILLVSQLFFSNGIILLIGLIIFYSLFYALQQPYKPSVFSIILFYHFLQISAGIWLSNYLNKDISFRSPSAVYATLAAYAGLVFLFTPIIYYQNKLPALTLKTLTQHANLLSIDKTFRVYVISFFVMNALTGIAFLVPSLTQIIFSVSNIKWFLFLLFGLQSILKNKRRREFILFCVLEFAMGFYSYFSEFKTILFFILFLFLCLLYKAEFKKLALAVVAIVLIGYGAIFWTSVKGEYRIFLNQGTNTQTVQVEEADALNKLIELSQKSNNNTFSDATEDFLDRLQYTYHLAKTMDRVPVAIPFQYGDNWATTLGFVLTPRFINPNKGVYDASVKASKYTGIRYSGIQRGVSVSLGYFADGYIDFGFVGMFAILLILGFIYGSSYFYFMRKSSTNFIFNIAVVGAIYMELFAFESDNIFVAGRLYGNLVVFFLLKIFLFPHLIRYIKSPTQLSN